MGVYTESGGEGDRLDRQRERRARRETGEETARTNYKTLKEWDTSLN